jgi:hypothetical protein
LRRGWREPRRPVAFNRQCGAPARVFTVVHVARAKRAERMTDGGVRLRPRVVLVCAVSGTARRIRKQFIKIGRRARSNA